MPKRIRPVRVEGKTAYVILNMGYEAVVDTCDLPIIEKYNWTALVKQDTIYVQRKCRKFGACRTTYMHRSIMGEPEGFNVDHVNGNGLDNRRSNLRLATVSQNGYNRRININNSSGFKGVSWNKSTGKWVAYITVNQERKHLGSFDKAEDAHAAYCEASRILHEGFGRTK